MFSPSWILLVLFHSSSEIGTTAGDGVHRQLSIAPGSSPAFLWAHSCFSCTLITVLVIPMPRCVSCTSRDIRLECRQHMIPTRPTHSNPRSYTVVFGNGHLRLTIRIYMYPFLTSGLVRRVGRTYVRGPGCSSRRPISDGLEIVQSEYFAGFDRVNALDLRKTYLSRLLSWRICADDRRVWSLQWCPPRAYSHDVLQLGF